MSDQTSQTWNAFCDSMDAVRREQKRVECDIAEIARQCAAEVARAREKAEADAMTRELAQRSTRRLDAGRKPIEESPLFGGGQQDLFDEPEFERARR
jgi:hypothetical protein